MIAPEQPAVAPAADLTALGELNARYIHAVVHADTAEFDDILAGDFLCCHPDGTMTGRDEFVWRTQAAAPLESMAVDDVRIRVLERVAIIHGRMHSLFRDGSRGTGRYTGVCVNRNGRWVAVAWHVTQLGG